jgi:uncharacterized membrane protein YgcG
MDLREARARRTTPRVTLLAALATIAMLVGSGIATVSGTSLSAAAALGHGVPAQLGAAHRGRGAKAPTPRARVANVTVVAAAPANFTSIYVPPPKLPVPVKAPAVKEAAAFAALNALLATETRFGEAAIAMRVALDRAQAADPAGAGLWFVRQANASAQYALLASSLLARFPALQAAMVKAFVADGMSVTLTPAQSAAAKAKLLRHLPASLPQLLAVAAAPYQPATVPEVAALKAAILDTAAFKNVVAHLAPGALHLPSAFASGSVTASELRIVAELKQYADGILEPVPASALPTMAGRFEPFAECEPGEALGDFLEKLVDGMEGYSAALKDLGGEAGAGAAEGLEPFGMALGFLFAGVVFWQVGQAFEQGGAGGGGTSGSGSSGGAGSGGESGGEGGGGCGGGNAASAGDPHQLTFSGADYDFQAAGEFTLVKSTTDDLDIQIRQEPYPGAANIAIDTATAMRVGNTIVELAVNASGHLQVWVDRVSVPYASRALDGGGKLSVSNPWAATVTWPDGTTVTVFSIPTTPRKLICTSRHAINLIISVPRSRFGHLEGLLGDPGKPPGELVGGNGTTYSLDELAQPWASAQDFDVLYHQFAQSWRLSQQGSLFYYPKGTSTASFTNLAFPGRALTVASLAPTTAAAAKRECKAEGVTNLYLLADCVFDLGLTGAPGACFAGAEARVQAATGGPTATGLPDSSGTIPASTKTAPTSPQPTTTTSPTTTPPAGTLLGSGTGAPPAIAVDASGTAYTVWQQSPTKLSFCKLATAASHCTPVTLEVADPSSAAFIGTPSVLLAPGRVYVLDLASGGPADLNGVNEFVSTDGGASFSPEPYAVGFVGQDSSPAGPAIALPGGDFGWGYEKPGDPAFQADSLLAPTDQSLVNTPPFATLTPQPANAYSFEQVGGAFGSQLVGSAGVLGVFAGFSGKSDSPCPSSASGSLVYAYAPIDASTTPVELSTSPGGSSPWRPLTKVDCYGVNPAVGGGPSGLGLLETDRTVGSIVQYRRFSPSSGFGPAVTIAKGEVAFYGSLSQDGAGDIFATWLDGSTGVDLAYSSDGGTTWSGPKLLFSNAGNPSAISFLASAVGASGQGWAVYAIGKRDYDLRFSWK